MNQNPFSLYDFLGYFIPGSILIYSFVIISACKELSVISLENLLDSMPSLKLESIILSLIISYSIGHILSFLSSITVEKYSIWRYGFPSRNLLRMNVPKFRSHFKTFHGFFWGLVIILLLLPTVILDAILGNFFGFKIFYGRPVDKPLAKLITFKINKLVEKLGATKDNGFNNGEGSNSDFFRIVQHYTYDNSKNHQSKFSNYVALYGFLRTMTFIMNILFWYLVIHFIISERIDLSHILIIISFSAISYAFFMAFMKFFRRYTLEGFMVLVVDKKIK